MESRHSKISPRLVSAVSTVAFLRAVSASPADIPKPTPRPGTLGAYAENVTLDRSTLSDETGRVVLTNDNVVVLAEGGSIIFGAVVTNGRGKPKPTSVADSAERARWRAAHRKQRKVIADLERRRSLIEIEIEHIGNLRLTVRTMARLQRVEAKLRDLDRQIEDERRELARIVREARRRGAEPGWFR